MAKEITREPPPILYSEKLRNIHTRNMAVVVSVVTIVHYVIAFAMNANVNLWLFILMISNSIVMLVLVYFNKYHLSKVLGLTVFLFVIYTGASTEDFGSGLHLQFFTASVVALTLFGYDRWPYSIAFALLAFVLYLVTYFYGCPWLEKRNFLPEVTRLLFIVNLAVGLFVSIYSILLFIKLNYQAENELQNKEAIAVAKSEELKEINKELDRFVYTASHDMRAPLNSVLGLVTLAELTELKPETRQYIGLIRGRIETLNNLISDIIDISRNAKQEVQREQINIKQVVESIINDLRYSSQSKPIIFKSDIDSYAFVKTDVRRLRSILNNFISNAIKYTDPSKEVSWIEVSCHNSETMYEIFVKDNGLGISADHQDKIFTMFFRATERSSGSGLGLYIANEMALQINAKINFVSELGKGSEFVLQLQK